MYDFEKLIYENEGKKCINRICPKCNKIIIHTINIGQAISCLKRNFRNAESKMILCMTCSRLGNKSPFKGRTHSIEHKNKLSNQRKGTKTGSDNVMANPLYRQKAIDGVKNKWKSGEMEHVRKSNSQLMINRHLNGNVNFITTSKSENDFFTFIKKIYPNSISQKYITSKPFDVFIPDLNLLIEYNGDYWHCNPAKYNADYYHQKKLKFAHEIWEYDKNKIYIAESLNYFCITIWESDFKNNPAIVFEKIENFNEKNKNISHSE